MPFVWHRFDFVSHEEEAERGGGGRGWGWRFEVLFGQVHEIRMLMIE